MWLINTQTRELKDFADATEAGVHYAILSHTWEDGEVTFQDLQSGRAKDKAGYSKIEHTCQQALRDGLDYAWIDSCCINKESSAELTQAINSMWKWYYQSAICYAYLSDLDSKCPELHDDPSLESEDEDTEHAETGTTAFSRCRWFTRGFTLQELIALQKVEFFNRVWSFVGSKLTLAATIGGIARIDPLVLQHRDSHRLCTIAKKMSWAAGRKTKYVEDRAYSLLGLFGVSMPTAKVTAFIRLQEEIVKESTDQSIFLWEPVDVKTDQIHADLLFASSPDQFKACHNVVRYQEVRVDAHFQLTNRGLVFEKLHICRSRHGKFAVLKCRFQDDFRGPLALRLCTEDEQTLSFERYTLLGKDEFWIGMGDKDQSDEQAALLDEWSVHERLIVYPSGDFSRTSFTDSQATLLWRHPAMLASRSSTQHLEYPVIWVRYDDSDTESLPFRILEALPSKYWNTRTGIFGVPARSLPDGAINAGIKVLFNREDRPIFLAFRVSPGLLDYKHGSPEGLCFRFIMFATSAAHAKDLLNDVAPTRKQYLNLTPTRRLKARFNLEQHRGEVVFVLRFSTKIMEPSFTTSSGSGQTKLGKIRKNYGGGSYSGGGGPQPRDNGIT